MGFLKVEKVQARDKDGNLVFLEDGSPLYNYDVVGILNDKMTRAHMDVVEKDVDSGGKKGARGYAYSQLELVFGVGENSADVHLERKNSSFTNSRGEIVERVTYEVVRYDRFGFDIRIPMRPRLATDQVILDNLLRFQDFLDAHPECGAEFGNNDSAH